MLTRIGTASFAWSAGLGRLFAAIYPRNLDKATDPVNEVFNAYSTRPENGGSVGYTHIFTPTLVNEFNPGYGFGPAIFQAANVAAAKAASPFLCVGAGLSPIFGSGANWPHGSDTTSW